MQEQPGGNFEDSWTSFQQAWDQPGYGPADTGEPDPGEVVRREAQFREVSAPEGRSRGVSSRVVSSRGGRRSQRRRRLELLVERHRRVLAAVAACSAVTLVAAGTALVKISVSDSSRPTALATSAPSVRPETAAPSPGHFELSQGKPIPASSAKPKTSKPKSATGASGSGGSGSSIPSGGSGWSLVYSQNFDGSGLPSGWGAYSGQPGGDPDGSWSPSNVTVSGGELHFLASNGSTGGVSFGGNPQTYGKYLVRMKADSEPGVEISDIALLWPSNGQWPPEIDFFEDDGGSRQSFEATVHPGGNGDNGSQIHLPVTNNATQWHTYGVEWTSDSIIITVDGRQVGTATRSEAGGSWPSIPMDLDLQAENLGSAQPRDGTETMTVDWVAEYALS